MLRLALSQTAIKRDFLGNKFSGSQRNVRNGNRTDVGEPVQALIAAVREACPSGIEQALSDDAKPLLSAEAKKSTEKQLHLLESKAEPSRNDNNEAATCRKTLDSAIQRKDRYNEKATTVLQLFMDRSEDHIKRDIQHFITVNKGDTLTALTQTLHYLNSNYFGTAFERRDQLTAKIAIVGVAFTTSDLGLLLNILNHIYDDALPMFVKREADATTDPPTHRILYDDEVPPPSFSSQRQALLVRMAASATVLAPYRQIVATAAPPTTFTQLTATLTAQMATDTPSLDQLAEVAQAPSQVFSASTATAQHEPDQLQTAFTAGIAFGKRKAFSEASDPPICPHWNGDSCNFEDQMQRECRHAQLGGHPPRQANPEYRVYVQYQRAVPNSSLDENIRSVVRRMAAEDALAPTSTGAGGNHTGTGSNPTAAGGNPGNRT